MSDQVENKIQQSKQKVQVQTGIELYTDKHQLGLVLRPVKAIKIPAISSKTVKDGIQASRAAKAKTEPNTGEAAPADPSAKDQLAAMNDPSKTLNALQTKLVATGTNVIKTDAEEYGPYIIMPLPEKIKDTLKVNYSTADLGMMAVGAIFADDVAKSFAGEGGLAKAMTGSASYVIRTLLQGIAPGAGGVAQKVAGNIPNPFSAAIFEKVSPRSFNFSWTIQPKNAEESERLKEIINILRYWSLPNPSQDRLVLAVPYEWVLSFTGTNFLYSFSRCVMTDLDIDFSPSGTNVFMRDTVAPQAVTISVTFQEIYPLDKSTIDEGSGGSIMRPASTSFREDNQDLTELKNQALAEETLQKDIDKEKQDQKTSLEDQIASLEAQLKKHTASRPKVPGAVRAWEVEGEKISRTLQTAKDNLAELNGDG